MLCQTQSEKTEPSTAYNQAPESSCFAKCGKNIGPNIAKQFKSSYRTWISNTSQAQHTGVPKQSKFRKSNPRKIHFGLKTNPRVITILPSLHLFSMHIEFVHSFRNSHFSGTLLDMPLIRLSHYIRL